MVNLPTWIPDCDSYSPALLDLLFSSDASIYSTMVFPLLGNSDHVVVSVSIDFPSNSKRDAPFHSRAYDYSCANWTVLVRNVPWDDIFKLSASAVVSDFLELMYISLIVSIRSSFTYLHGLQLLVLLPQFIEITFFVCADRINLLNLK